MGVSTDEARNCVVFFSVWTTEGFGIAVGLVLKPASRGPLERALEVVGVVVGLVLKAGSRVPHE